MSIEDKDRKIIKWFSKVEKNEEEKKEKLKSKPKWSDGYVRRRLLIDGLESLWTYYPEKSFIGLLHMVVDPENKFVVSIPIRDKDFIDNIYELIKEKRDER